MTHINIEQALTTASLAAGLFSTLGLAGMKVLGRSIKSGAGEVVTAQVAEVQRVLAERIDRSDAKTEEVKKVVEAKLDKISEKVEKQAVDQARQFGGNGGGLREAVNTNNETLAKLAGQFEQHLREQANR